MNSQQRDKREQHHNVVAGKEGFDPNEIYGYRSFAARRTVIAGPQAGKPSIAKLDNEEILVSYIKGYGPRSSCQQIEVVRSKDGGETWSDAICAVHPSHVPHDHYLIPLQDGTLLLAFLRLASGDLHGWHGPYLARSTDGGHTWEEPTLVELSGICSGPWGTPDRGGHGQLPDGTFLFFVSIWEDMAHCVSYVLRSKDNGQTFYDQSLVSDLAGDNTFAILPSGKILGALRVNYVDWPHRDAHADEAWKHESTNFMAITESNDKGCTWSKPYQLTNFNEIPAHLLVLKDGTILLTFGVRHYPLGVQAMVSTDEGMTWNTENRTILAWHGELVVQNDFKRHACGHPYSVELSDGEILTAYYRWDNPFLDPNSCQIEGVFWNIKDCLET